MSEREDSDSDAPEEFTSEQGFELDEQIRKVQKENKARLLREGKERRRQWVQRKTPRPSKEGESVKEVLEDSETERETLGTNGMLPENIVQLLAAHEKKVFASDSEDEKDEAKPRPKKKKLKTAGIETVVLKNTVSEIGTKLLGVLEEKENGGSKIIFNSEPQEPSLSSHFYFRLSDQGVAVLSILFVYW